MTLSRSLTRIRNSQLLPVLYAPKHSSSMPFQASTDTNSLFHYTSGRWLWNEQEQLKARYRQFDISGLKQVACQTVGAKQCLSLEKLGEGNYNKAYRLVMEDGQTVVAKIPHPNAGPPVLTTSSEVATMKFIRTVLEIPVPKVLAWSATDQNPVNAEYIIMEEARGSQLHKAWQTLQLRAKRNVIHEIVDIERKLLSVSFDKIGSLYLNNSGVPSCTPFSATINSKKIDQEVQSKFCIGPIIRREFWEKERSKMNQYHGPWASSVEYLQSIVHREIEWIKTYADPQKSSDNPWQYTSREQHCPKAHISALQKLLSAIPHIIPQDAELLSSRTWHPDFHAGNIYIDDQARITSIIDWQGSWTTPVFIGANPPPLLDYSIDMMMKLPENFKDLDEATKERLRYQVAQSILIHSYETLTAEKNPLMHKMMHHPHGKTLKQLEAFSSATWDNCLFPLQECLINVEKEWEHFGTQVPCPYHFSKEEVQKHQAEVEGFNDSRRFWDELQEILTDEGYTSNDTYEKAIEILKDLRETGLAGLKGEERDEFDRKTHFVMDP